MAEKVKLFVNGQEVEVESGKNLIDAIGAVGIEIPHLCYHPALGADGNCRMCLVGIEDGRPPLVPACKTNVAEGMKVQLDTEKIKKIQRDIMELELINHPIDCPICDQAGECKLQDYYMQYDGQKSRMTVPPVLKAKHMDFGGGVVHDQERCILCARCVRFTRMITKTGELGIVNRTDYARVTTFPGRPLSNRYALNVVDLCPVGAMTSKDFRFKQRAWFLTKSESLCHGCSKGCNIYIDHNKEKYQDDVIYRFRPRLNQQVNGYFMCDAGRMTYKLENDNRINTAQIFGKEASLNEAVEALRRTFSQAKKTVFLVSPNCSLEQMQAVNKLAVANNAIVSGYSEGYIKTGDGDDFLIQDDKSANRAAFTLLGIESSKSAFEAALEGADLLVSFQNDISCSLDDAALAKIEEKTKIAYIGSYQNGSSDIASIIIPVASYSEDKGTLINADNILQRYEVAVIKNAPVSDLIHVVNLLGGELKNHEEALTDLSATIAALNNIDLKHIPSEGIALTDKRSQMSQLDILLLILRVAFAAFVPLCFIAVCVWMERRGAGFIQDRSGPNRANIFGFRAGGLVQNLADAIKLITKEDVIPGHIKQKFYFVLAPVIVFTIALVSFAAVPFADTLVINGKQYIMQGIPTDLGILWFLALAGFGVYGIILAGWSSHNKYGVLGGLRAAAQVISYEIPMGLAIVSALIVYGTVNLTEIAQFQGQLLFGFIPMWGIILQPIGAIIFIVAAFAETNRTPFDLAEGESELVAGFHVEYSSMKFGMFFMGEYVAMFTSSALIVTLYFGGFQIPWFSTETLVSFARPVSVLLMLLMPVFAKLFTFWISKNNKSQYERVDDPRVREAQVYIKAIWGIVIALEIVLFIYLITVSGGVADRILVTILQIITFLVKTTLMCFVYVWVRWTLPRFRYDQLQRLGWQTLLPLSLLNIFVTSAIVVALG